MPHLQKNGLSHHVQQMGEGPTLVMLHGLLVGSLATWYFSAAPLLARRYRVLLYDLRGHGLSERVRTGYDVATLAADLAALVEGEQELSLVGHSYGGLVALRFAADHPERVRRLAVVDAPLPGTRVSEMSVFSRLPPEQMVQSLPLPLQEAVSRGRRQAMRLLDSLRFLTTETSMLVDMERNNLPDELLARVRCPVLLAYGERSSCRSVGERLSRTLASAELKLLQGGHFLPVEVPEALSACLKEFLHA